MTFPFLYLIMYILDAELTEGQRWHRNGLQKQVFSWQTTVRKTVSCQKDFYSKHSLEQSRWLRISCSIKLEIHESFTISGSSLCSKYSSIKWARKGIAYRTFLCFKSQHRGKSFCKTYILHLPQESASGSKIQ